MNLASKHIIISIMQLKTPFITKSILIVSLLAINLAFAEASKAPSKEPAR
jgi:hypothetical protein